MDQGGGGGATSLPPLLGTCSFHGKKVLFSLEGTQEGGGGKKARRSGGGGRGSGLRGVTFGEH